MKEKTYLLWFSHYSQKYTRVCQMCPFKLETYTSVLVRLQGIKNLLFMSLLLKVIKKMNVIRGDYSHSPSWCSGLCLTTLSDADDSSGILRNRSRHLTACCLLAAGFFAVTKTQEIILKQMGNKIITDLLKKHYFCLQKQVLVPFLIADTFILQKFIVQPAANSHLNRLLCRGEHINQLIPGT